MQEGFLRDDTTGALIAQLPVSVPNAISATAGQLPVATGAGTVAWKASQGVLGYVNVMDPAVGCKGNANTVNDGAMNNGSGILTSVTAAFTAADVGKSIFVQGAQVAGTSGGMLKTTIASYQSATQVTLTATMAAAGSLTGALVVYGTDDTTAFVNANALNQALSVVSTLVLYFPTGNYIIAPTVITRDNLTWVGDGGATLMTTLDVSINNTDIAFRVIGSNVTLQGLKFQGLVPVPQAQKANAANGDMVRLGGNPTGPIYKSNIRIIDCDMRGGTQPTWTGGLGGGGANAGFQVNQADNVTIRGCTVQNSTGNSIGVADCRGDVVITGNQVKNSGDDMIVCVTDSQVAAGTLRLVISNNTCKSGFAKGIGTTGTDRCVIANNHVENTWAFGIACFTDSSFALGPSNNCIVEGNTVIDAGQNYGASLWKTVAQGSANGIEIDGNNLRCHGNVVIHPDQRGINANGTAGATNTDIDISGNLVFNTGATGISAGSAATNYTALTDVTIIGNDIRGVKGGIFVGSITGLKVSKNLIRGYSNATANAGLRGIQYGYVQRATITANTIVNDDSAGATTFEFPSATCPDTHLWGNHLMSSTASVDADSYTRFTIGGVAVIVGAGSPNTNAIVANVGSLFLQTDGVGTAACWVKGSGSAGSGWISGNPQVLTAVLGADVGPISLQTALQNITGLGLAIGASATEVWLVKYWLLVNAANATMDVKFGFTVPAACTMQFGTTAGLSSEVPSWGARNVAGAPQTILTASGNAVPGTAAGTIGIGLTGVVFGGGTAGTVQVQYAQNTSDAGNLSISKGSIMEATKVAA